MRLRLAVKMERMRCGMQAHWRWRRFFAASLGRLVDATRHGLHQLLGIVKITLPQQARAFAGQAIGLVGIECRLRRAGGGGGLADSPVHVKPSESVGGLYSCVNDQNT